MIEDVETVWERNPGRDQVGNSTDDPSRREIASGVVIAPDDRNARVVAGACLKQLMQVPEVVVVAGQENALLANGVGQVDRIGTARQPDVRGNLHIVPRMPQETD